MISNYLPALILCSSVWPSITDWWCTNNLRYATSEYKGLKSHPGLNNTSPNSSSKTLGARCAS